MQEAAQVEVSRFIKLSQPLKVLFLILSAFGIGLAVYFSFGLSFIFGESLITYQYYWLLIAVFSSSVFLILPARKKDANRLPWYDIAAAILTFGACFYNFLNAWEQIWAGWSSVPTGIILALLMLEGARRVAGPIFLAVCLTLGLYPLYGHYMPGFFSGISFSFTDTVVY